MIPQIKHYLKAGAPVLFLRTVDYDQALDRGIDALRILPASDNAGEMQVATWSITSGLKKAKLKKEGKQVFPKEGEDVGLIDALAWIEEMTNAALFCFNVRQFLSDSPADVQALIEAAMAAKRRFSHIFLIGPDLPMIPELKNLIVYPSMPLPTHDELTDHFRDLISDGGHLLSFPDGKPWVSYLPKSVGGKRVENAEYRKDEKEQLISAAARAATGMSLFAAEQALALSLGMTRTVDAKIVLDQKKTEIATSDVLTYISPDETLASIGGFDALKDWLQTREKAFSPEARKYGLSFPKGILLCGVAGSGKSLVAKAISSFLGIGEIRLDVSRIHRKYYGESEGIMADALRIAEAVAPSILWVDRILSTLKRVNSVKPLTSNVEGNTEPSQFVRLEGVETSRLSA